VPTCLESLYEKLIIGAATLQRTLACGYCPLSVREVWDTGLLLGHRREGLRQ
jgi:hypothetical protein